MKTCVTVCFFILALLVTGSSADVNEWTKVRPLEAKQVFTGLGKSNIDTPFVALLESERGAPAYELECHNGNYDNAAGMDFSGDFQCALFALNGTSRISGNLLAADTKNELSTDWWNRGRIRADQLRGECLKYPEYSSDRHFKLRGMLLTLRFTDVQWAPGADQQNHLLLNGFTFTFSVVPDQSARSSRAELPSGPEPPQPCYP